MEPAGSQTAYECWHLVEVFFEWRGTPLDLRSLPVMLAQLAAGAFFYFVICTTLSRKMSYKGVYNIGPRQLTSAFFIGILFMFQAALLSGGQVVALDRSLVMTMFVGQFYFLTLLYFQTEVFKLSAMQKEMDTLNLLYERQREQYQVARQNVQIINKRCHELKLQIAALRQMSSAPADPELKATSTRPKRPLSSTTPAETPAMRCWTWCSRKRACSASPAASSSTR